MTTKPTTEEAVEAPKRIWIGDRAKYLLDEEGSCLCYRRVQTGGVEYVRADFLLAERNQVRRDALRDAIKDVCLYCRNLGSGFKTEVIRNDNGVYIHESHEHFTAIGPKIAQCKASAIHERIKIEAGQQGR